eukprot:GFYU01000331.1.p1 GENE.GFYU01000331.1~~GFYU01000331.1.p1  ORF type:complete len:432 (-),score=103.96 GFYU01000331.1:930-2225(-)
MTATPLMAQLVGPMQIGSLEIPSEEGQAFPKMSPQFRLSPDGEGFFDFFNDDGMGVGLDALDPDNGTFPDVNISVLETGGDSGPATANTSTDTFTQNVEGKVPSMTPELSSAGLGPLSSPNFALYATKAASPVGVKRKHAQLQHKGANMSSAKYVDIAGNGGALKRKMKEGKRGTVAFMANPQAPAGLEMTTDLHALFGEDSTAFGHHPHDGVAMASLGVLDGKVGLEATVPIGLHMAGHSLALGGAATVAGVDIHALSAAGGALAADAVDATSVEVSATDAPTNPQQEANEAALKEKLSREVIMAEVLRLAACPRIGYKPLMAINDPSYQPLPYSPVLQGQQADAPRLGASLPTSYPTPLNLGAEGDSKSPVKCIGKYTPEERKERLARFKQKRSQRVWVKKIKYACRKNLADKRPRVGGRFVKASELKK